MGTEDSRRENENYDEVFYLEPGFIYIGSDKSAVKTVLGNCVSVCLWDTRLRFGGMNHFMYPMTKDKSKATAIFGNVATRTLIQKMGEAGSNPKDIVAQIVGGAKLEKKKTQDIGRENANIARQILLRENIEIKSEDIGGHLGRKVIFDVNNGHLMVIKVHQIRSSDWKDPSLTDHQE